MVALRPNILASLLYQAGGGALFLTEVQQGLRLGRRIRITDARRDISCATIHQ